MKLKRPEPTLIVQFVSSLIVLLGTFGWDALTPEQAGLLVGAITAVAAAVNAIMVRPIAVPIVAGAINAVAAVVVGWGLKVSPETLGALTFVAMNALAFLGTRNQATPVSDPAAGGGVPMDVAVALRNGSNPL